MSSAGYCKSSEAIQAACLALDCFAPALRGYEPGRLLLNALIDLTNRRQRTS
jgi:hypothetical protein